jgi:glycosyltransferase involved in cell wall biosynthesis
MKVLFIVEPDFLHNHVGVRRVIRHYIDQLHGEGHDVALACLSKGQKGQLVSGQLSRKTLPAQDKQYRPYWSSHSAKDAIVQAHADTETQLEVTWSSEPVDPQAFELCVVTNPWLCARGLPPIRNAVGIAYDLVPNLLALGGLHFQSHIEIYQFAHEHDIGFRYFIENCARVLCISQSTKDDLLRLYPEARRIPDVFVDIPFPATGATGITVEHTGTTPSVLVVNALDWRKNFKGISRILHNAAAKDKRLQVNIVGHERIPKREVLAMLEDLASGGLNVHWFRNAEEPLLQHLYRTSDVLLFPSFYEGLGLPILEAQAAGLPVISSNNSSCKEVNMNPSLMFDVTDEAGMTNALLAQALGSTASAQCLRGAPLLNAQKHYLSHASRGLLPTAPAQADLANTELKRHA